MRKILPFLALAGAAAYFFNQFNIFKAGLKARLGVVKFNLPDTRANGFFKIVLDVQVIISNPSKVQGKITGANIDVLLQDKLIANISKVGAFMINAGTDSTVIIKLQLPTLSLVDSIATLIRNLGTGLGQTVSIRGVINTNLGTVSVAEQIKFNL
jgi:hypothetical protein